MTSGNQSRRVEFTIYSEKAANAFVQIMAINRYQVRILRTLSPEKPGDDHWYIIEVEVDDHVRR